MTGSQFDVWQTLYSKLSYFVHLHIADNQMHCNSLGIIVYL